MTKQFFADVLRLQVKRLLREQPDLIDNPNGLILAVWQESGLRLKRKQPVSSYLLPQIGEIDEVLTALQNEESGIDDVEAAFEPDKANSKDGMEYEPHPLEPKPKRAKKIKVKGARSGNSSRSKAVPKR